MVKRENSRRFLLGFIIGLCTIQSFDYFVATSKDSQVTLIHEQVSPPTTILQSSESSGLSPTTTTTATLNGTTLIETLKRIAETTNMTNVAAATKPSSAQAAPTGQQGSSNSSKTAAVTKSANATTYQDFVHHPGVVIAVKIHGENHVEMLKQSLCLLHAAYNHVVLYDVLIFSTLPISEISLGDLRRIVHPASLTIAVDEYTLQGQLQHQMDQEQRDHLVNRCLDANTTADLQWGTRCKENKRKMPIAYTWMSEFRSRQIWMNVALRPYKYMLWFDSDAFPMLPWDQDPIAYMMREDLVLLMANYAQSTTVLNSGVQQKLHAAYNKTLCKQDISTKTGKLHITYGPQVNSCQNGVKQAHGFFHITNLDYYRLPEHQKWFEIMVGRHRFSRLWDDQLAVVVPAVMGAPERTREMRGVGLHLSVMHNGMLMGKSNIKGGGYLAYWRREGKAAFPKAAQWCNRLIKVGSR